MQREEEGGRARLLGGREEFFPIQLFETTHYHTPTVVSPATYRERVHALEKRNK